MRKVYNRILPVKGFVAINLFGVLFIRNEFRGKITWRTFRHEVCHTKQMKYLGYVPFYLLYVLFWFALVAKTWKDGVPLKSICHTAYRKIPFEIEARNAESTTYDTGKYSWTKYLKEAFC